MYPNWVVTWNYIANVAASLTSLHSTLIWTLLHYFFLLFNLCSKWGISITIWRSCYVLLIVFKATWISIHIWDYPLSIFASVINYKLDFTNQIPWRPLSCQSDGSILLMYFYWYIRKNGTDFSIYFWPARVHLIFYFEISLLFT